MAFTVQSLVDQARALYPDMPESSALAFANVAHVQLLSYAQLTRDFEDITLVANQLTYALPDDVLKIWQAVFYDFVQGKRFVYKQVGVRELERYAQKFRVVATSQICGEVPVCFVDARAGGTFDIGLYPPPTVSTSVSGPDTGFPVLRVYCTRKQILALIAGAGLVTSLPESVRDDTAYMMFIAWRWALIHDKANAANWREAYLAERVNLKSSISNLLHDVQPRSDPFIKRTSRPC